MLIEAITFEIHNAKLHIHEEYVVENTDDNYENILRNRFTRQIKFIKYLDFDFAKKERVPVSFIDVPDTIDEIDEMVGAF